MLETRADSWVGLAMMDRSSWASVLAKKCLSLADAIRRIAD